MSDKIWERLLIWKVSGPRFDEHRGVDLSDLAGLVGLRVALLEVAKIIWRERYGRERIPDGAERVIDLRIKGFEDGSEQATVWLGRPASTITPPRQRHLFGAPAVVDDLASFAESIHDAAEALQNALSDRDALAQLPRDVIRQLQITGKGLREDEHWSIQAFGRPELEPAGNGQYYEDPPAVAARTVRKDSQPFHWTFLANPERRNEERLETEPRQTMPRTAARIVPPVNATLRATLDLLATPPKIPELRVEQRTMSGEVTRVDVDGLAKGSSGRGKVGIRPDGHIGEPIEIEFLPKDEATVTSALHKHHNKARLRVRGDAYINEFGRMKRFEARVVAEVQAPSANAMSEEFFERLAEDDPSRLISLLEPGVLEPPLLTFAAEVAGRNLPAAVVVPHLLSLLGHERSIVREGAIYGLRGHRSLEVTKAIQHVAENDSSLGVRRAAEGVLKSR